MCTPPPPSTGWAEFTVMMEFTPESGHCQSIFTLSSVVSVSRNRTANPELYHPEKQHSAQNLPTQERSQVTQLLAVEVFIKNSKDVSPLVINLAKEKKKQRCCMTVNSVYCIFIYFL